MTFFRPGPPEQRRNLDELDCGLETGTLGGRLLSLDEPVARDDWADVVRRAGTLRSGRRLARSGALLAGVFAVAAAGAVVGVRVAEGPAVPAASAQTAFHQAPGRDVLVVSSMKPKGVCYEWKGEAGACERRVGALGLSWSNGRVVGAVSASSVSSVKITFTDGTSVEPGISWVAGPINAGFFLYRIPPGKTVVDVSGYDRGRTSGQVPWYSV